MRLRYEGLVLAAAAWLAGVFAPVAAAGAQQAPAGVDAACACFVTEAPGGEGEPGDGRDRRWAFAGLAGLALLAGLPLGGGAGPAGMPFGAAGAEPVPVAELGPGAPVVAGVPAELPEAAERVRPEVAMAGSAPDPAAMVPASPSQAAVGMVPPKTATHLPLLAAAGILLVGSGSVLARRTARQKRRRRRLVTF